MSTFYLDTSAVVKRYLVETGSVWIAAQVDPHANHAILIGEITRVEAAAAIAARQRASGGISLQDRDDAVDLLLRHCDSEYHVIPLVPEIISRAVALTQIYRLRGYDAIQLATALVVNQQYSNAGLVSLMFVSADNDLVAAAQSENLPTENPNQYA